MPSTRPLSDDDALKLCRATVVQQEQGDDDSLKPYCLGCFIKTEHIAKTITHHEQVYNTDARNETV